MTTGGEFLTKTTGELQVFTRENFSEEQREIARTVEEFATERIRPNKRAIEKFNKELSLELLRECGELGLLSIDVPEKYGGLGLDKVTSAIVAEKLSYGMCASFSTTVGAHAGIGTLPIVFFGNEAQKEKYLPRLSTAEWVSAYALTEAGSGSDALAAKSTAVPTKDGTGYILNGSKQFITNGNWADVFIVFANVDGSRFTGFIVDRDSPGLSVGPEEHKMGIKGSSTATVHLENVRVPAENVLGEIGGGAAIAFNTLNIGRFKLGAATLGGCKVALEEALQYASERRQFGQPIRNFDAIKGYFADMTTRIFALDSMIYRTVGLMDKAVSNISDSCETYNKQVAEAIESYAIEASMCKVVGSETLWFVADMGVQIFGGYGFIEEYPLASVLRDNRIDRIFEGTNEINRQIISGYFLRKALMEELPIREAIREIDFDGLRNGSADFVPKAVDLAKETQSLRAAKMLTLYVFNEAICKFGQDLKNEQQISCSLSDLFTDVYLVEGVLSRVTQLASGNETESVLQSIVQVYCAEKSYDTAATARKILCSLLEGERLKTALENLNKVNKVLLLDTDLFALKQDIAEDLYARGKYSY